MFKLVLFGKESSKIKMGKWKI